MAKLALRQDQLAKFRRLSGIKTDLEFAKRIGVHRSQVSRVLSGDAAPGPRFIAGVVALFGVECFQDLFTVIPDDNGDEE